MSDSVVAALIASTIGLVGIVVTQILANRRAMIERGERHKEWIRDKVSDAHSAFVEAQWHAEHTMTMRNLVGIGEVVLPEDWTEPMARELARVSTFAIPATAEKAQKLFRTTAEMAGPEWGVGGYQKLDDAKSAYIEAFQKDLKIDS